ncbi:MAG TPA: TraR/DksA C4-type zinc finger protein [Gemmatimonadales bacterium]|nr:TraR/DksA C4-type zinc finger protein [Gemmatimonadales bacterium]
MTAVQRKHFERRLMKERAYTLDLLNRATSDAASQYEQDRAGDLSQWPTHMADRGTDTIDEELAASNATRLSRELAEIEAALERLHATPQRYGICDDTGRPIPLQRLEVIPWARTLR